MSQGPATLWVYSYMKQNSARRKKNENVKKKKTKQNKKKNDLLYIELVHELKTRKWVG